MSPQQTRIKVAIADSVRVWAGAFAFLLTVISSPAVAASERTVVVVLFDGFAPAELDATKNTPNFDRLKREGAWSRHLVPAFPTISMTNHTTFETGCWPAHHGIMSNIFYDPERGLLRRRQCRPTPTGTRAAKRCGRPPSVRA